MSDADAGGDGALGRVVLAGVTANLAAGTLFAWSLVARDAADGVGLSERGSAGVFATAIVVFSAVLLAVGPLQRRWGERRLLTGSAVLGGAGLLLAATATGPAALWAGFGVVFGVANGVAYGVAVALTARVPARRRGAATGLVVAAYAAGPAILGLVAPPALEHGGWRPALGGLAAVVAALLAVAAVLVPARGRRSRSAGGARTRLPAGELALLWLVFACGAAPGLALFAQAVPLALDRRLGVPAAGLAVSALALGNLAGRLAAGWWSDRVGRLPALGTSLAVGAVSVGGLSGPTAVPVVLAAFLGSGLTYGAVSALVPATTADRVGPAAFPAAYGRVFTGWGIAGLLAPVAGEGLLHLAEGRPLRLALVAVPLVLAAAALALLGRRGGRVS